MVQAILTRRTDAAKAINARRVDRLEDMLKVCDVVTVVSPLIVRCQPLTESP